MKLRQSTVEPVIGTLVNFLGIKRVNTKGLSQANKCLTMASVAYNLKKMLKHKPRSVQDNIQSLKNGIKKPFKLFYARQSRFISRFTEILCQMIFFNQKIILFERTCATATLGYRVVLIRRNSQLTLKKLMRSKVTESNCLLFRNEVVNGSGMSR